MREPIPFRPSASRRDDGERDAGNVARTRPMPAFDEPSARDRISGIVARQPLDATYDDILRELAFERLVRRGLDDLAGGHLLDTDDVMEAFHTWPR